MQKNSYEVSKEITNSKVWERFKQEPYVKEYVYKSPYGENMVGKVNDQCFGAMYGDAAGIPCFKYWNEWHDDEHQPWRAGCWIKEGDKVLIEKGQKGNYFIWAAVDTNTWWCSQAFNLDEKPNTTVNALLDFEATAEPWEDLQEMIDTMDMWADAESGDFERYSHDESGESGDDYEW